MDDFSTAKVGGKLLPCDVTPDLYWDNPQIIVPPRTRRAHHHHKDGGRMSKATSADCASMRLAAVHLGDGYTPEVARTLEEAARLKAQQDEARGQKHDQGKRGTVLLEAMDVINGERQDSYGNPEDSHETIAAFWGAYLGISLTAREAAEMMVLMKMARMRGQKPHRDNYRDAAGYIGIAADMVSEECCQENTTETSDKDAERIALVKRVKAGGAREGDLLRYLELSCPASFGK